MGVRDEPGMFKKQKYCYIKKKITTLLKHSKKVKNPMKLKRLAGSISYRKLGRDSLNATCVLLYFIVREYITTQRLRI